jgi:hypothetical protein
MKQVLEMDGSLTDYRKERRTSFNPFVVWYLENRLVKLRSHLLNTAV